MSVLYTFNVKYNKPIQHMKKLGTFSFFKFHYLHIRSVFPKWGSMEPRGSIKFLRGSTGFSVVLWYYQVFSILSWYYQTLQWKSMPTVSLKIYTSSINVNFSNLSNFFMTLFDISHWPGRGVETFWYYTVDKLLGLHDKNKCRLGLHEIKKGWETLI